MIFPIWSIRVEKRLRTFMKIGIKL
jgi:hypothetical protein